MYKYINLCPYTSVCISNLLLVSIAKKGILTAVADQKNLVVLISAAFFLPINDATKIAKFTPQSFIIR